MRDRLYKVSFSFQSDYSPKTPGAVCIIIAVMADSQFSALTSAWQSLASLELPEPTEFSAKQVGKDC